eukprot:5845657-Amphidinium_carterae.1
MMNQSIATCAEKEVKLVIFVREAWWTHLCSCRAAAGAAVRVGKAVADEKAGTSSRKRCTSTNQ